MVVSYLDYFPKESEYPNQADAMERIHGALAEGRDVLFEGACGTGKTLSALVPSLEYAQRSDKTVVITTNVHQQMRQFVMEAREIREMQDVRVSVFQGKSSMCHIDVGYEECDALRDNTRRLVDLEDERDEIEGGTSSEVRQLEAIESEIEEVEDRTCGYYYSNLREDNQDFFGWLDSGVRTPEEVKERAEACGKCGYELLKERMDAVDLVICNYHHLLNPEIRRYFYNWLDRPPDEVVAVFDEAHNLESAAREHSSRTLTRETLERAELELAENDMQELRGVLERFREALTGAVEREMEFGDAERGDWTDVSVALEDAEYPDAVTREFLENSGYMEDELPGLVERGLEAAVKLDREYERMYKRGETDARRDCPSLAAYGFLRDYLGNAGESGYHPIAAVRRRNGLEHRLELYTCIPREVTGELFAGLHSSVLMSATLRPFDVLEEVLGLDDPVRLAYGLEFPEERRETLVADLPPLFSRKREDAATVEKLKGFLEDVVDYSAGNVLVFFPSYSEAERYHGKVEVDADVMLDKVGESARGIREGLEGDGKKAVFTYLWGTLTEGVDYPDDVARTAVVVGVGYPYLGERTRAVQEAYDAEFGDGWRYGVEAPTIRKTRQALGRVVRSPTDYGVRILADHRYSPNASRRYGVYTAFPSEEREEFVEVDHRKVRYAMHNFWSRVGVDVENEGVGLD